MNTNEQPSPSDLEKAIARIERARSIVSNAGINTELSLYDQSLTIVLTAAKRVKGLEQEQAGIRIALQREFDTKIQDEEDVLDLIGKFIDHHKEKEQQLRANKELIERLVGEFANGRDALSQIARLANINQGTRDIIIGVGNHFNEALSLATQKQQPRSPYGLNGGEQHQMSK